MRVRTGAVGIVAAVAAQAACGAIADAYVCIADLSAGIGFNKQTGRWESTRFAAEEKVLLSRAAGNLSDHYKWIAKNVGATTPKFGCKADFDRNGYLTCVGPFGEFRFNHRNGRYLSTYLVGYVSDGLGKDSISTEEGADTPAVTAGKCSPL